MSTPTITETTTPPRTRWAAIIWGLLFAVVAGSGLWLLADDGRRSEVADGLLSLTPTTIITIVLLTVGVLLVIAGATGLVRRAQRKLATASSSPREVPDPLAE